MTDFRVPGDSSRRAAWRDVVRRADAAGRPLVRPPFSWHLQRGSPTFMWWFVAGVLTPAAFVPLAAEWRVVVSGGAAWAWGGSIVSFRSRWLLFDEHGLEFRDYLVRRGVEWSEVASIEIGDRGHPRSSVYLWLELGPGPRRRVSPPPIARDHVWRLRDAIKRSGFEIPINPTPPWRDRWGAWHGPMFERDPQEAIRSVHEAHVGPWRIRIRKVDGEYQALIEMTIGNARVREGPRRPTLRAASDDGSRFVLDAQATLAAGGDVVTD